MRSVSLQIEGMSCDHCVRAVKNALDAMSGVQTTNVRIGQASATITDAVTDEQLRAAIEEEGFEVVTTS